MKIAIAGTSHVDLAKRLACVHLSSRVRPGIHEDFVIATGKQYSVRQFIEWTATELGMQIRWEGEGVNEVAFCHSREGGNPSPQHPIIRIDPRYFRPTEVETLLGDPTKAKQKLGWVPEITAQEMCAEMVTHDLADARKHALLKHHGYKVNVSVE